MFTCKFKFSDLEVLRNFIVNNNLDFKKVVILSATELDMPVMIQDITDTTEKPIPVVTTIKAPRKPSVVRVEHVIVPKEEPPPPKEEPPPLKEEEVAHKPKRKKPAVDEIEPAVSLEEKDIDPPEPPEATSEEPSTEDIPSPGLSEDFLEDDESTLDDEVTDGDEEEEDDEDEPQETIVHSVQPPSNAEFRNTDLADSLKNVTIDTHEDEEESEEEDEPPKKLYNKMCHKCGNPFTSEVSSAKFCPACMPQRTAKPKPEKPPKKPKPPASQPVVVKPTGPRRCIRCGSLLPEDSQSKICYKCAKTLADSGRELSDVMRTEIELALSCKPSKISKVCLKCREPFFTEEGSPASYCPSCMKKLAAQESEIPKKTGFF